MKLCSVALKLQQTADSTDTSDKADTADSTDTADSAGTHLSQPWPSFGDNREDQTMTVTMTKQKTIRKGILFTIIPFLKKEPELLRFF